jgi:hypothetical protein
MDDERQRGFRLSDPRQAEVRGWPEPALPTDREHSWLPVAEQSGHADAVTGIVG